MTTGAALAMWTVSLTAVALMAPLVARADLDAGVPSAEVSSATPDPRRDPAFYRGRSRAPTAEEGLTWVPRIVLFPLYLVCEYLIRTPFVAFLGWAERNHVLPYIERILNPIPDFTWSPTLAIETGLYVLPGVTARWRNMGVHGHELRVAGAYGDADFWSASLHDQWTVGPVHFGVRTGYQTRPNGAFYGLGPGSPNVRMNLTETHGEAAAFVGVAHENYVRLDLSVGWAHEVVSPGITPTIEAASARNTALGLGPFELLLVGLDVRLDTRRDRQEDGGVRVRVGARYGMDPRTSDTRFLTVNGELEGAVEVSRPGRILAARVYVAESVPLSDGPIPFLELPMLGAGNLRGFVLGRFRGEAAVVGELRYRYPIAYFVDLQWIAAVGNVFARGFSDFSFGALNGSLGVGIRTRATGQDPVEATVAIGTTRFDSNFSVQSIGLSLSTSGDL